MPNLSPQIAAIVLEAIAHRFRFRPMPEIDADTELAEIADDIDRDTIAHAVEEAGGFILSDGEIARWRTVGDVEASLRAVLAQAGSAAA